MEQDLILHIDEIDRQHGELLEQLDVLRDHVRRGHSKEAIYHTLTFLERYAEEHFSTEARYMTQYRYPDIDTHKAEHEAFARDLAAFKDTFSSLVAKGEMTTFLGLDLVRKLNLWLAEHIMNVDKKMGAFLAEKMAGPGPDAPR